MKSKKVFISSTAYKLRDLRTEIINLLESNDYSVLHHESSKFPVRKGMHSHDVCLEAVKECDIFILIIDYRYGQVYCGKKYPKKDISITWYEFITALLEKKRIFVFVRDNVFNERITYKRSENKTEFSCTHTDNIKTFEFIDYITQQKKENWLNIFSDSVDLKKQIRDRLSFYFHQLKVLFYGDFPETTNKDIIIRVWHKRPSSYHYLMNYHRPSFLEDMTANLINIEGSMANYHSPISFFYSILDKSEYYISKFFPLDIHGTIISNTFRENCHILDVGVSKKMYTLYQNAVKYEDKFSTQYPLQAFDISYKNSVINSISESINNLKDFINKSKTEGVVGRELKKLERACSKILRIREHALVNMSTYCDGNPEIEDHYKTIIELKNIVPKKIRNELVNILIECIIDRGKLYIGTVGSFACNALVNMKHEISSKQKGILLQTFDLWLGGTDFNSIDDAAFCLKEFDKWLPEKMRNGLITKLKSIILHHEQPEINLFYVADALKKISKGCIFETALEDKLRSILSYRATINS